MAMRLDKYLAQAGLGTRSEVKKLIRSGRVFLNGLAAKKSEEKVEAGAEVLVDGTAVIWSEFEYFMLNKPAGVVSATQDGRERTVVELIRERSRDIFPVGRLDKDTEGLLLLTNDGELAHELLSPRKHVAKRYQVLVEGMVQQEDCELFAKGMDIGDEKLTKPALLTKITYYNRNGERLGELQKQNKTTAVIVLTSNEEIARTGLEITITEGRYHQIKRMFVKVGKPVLYLKRISMGSLALDDTLAPGEYRRLTEDELENLKEDTQKRIR